MNRSDKVLGWRETSGFAAALSLSRWQPVMTAKVKAQ